LIFYFAGFTGKKSLQVQLSVHNWLQTKITLPRSG
jgi:hypothetical protein